MESHSPHTMQRVLSGPLCAIVSRSRETVPSARMLSFCSGSCNNELCINQRGSNRAASHVSFAHINFRATNVKQEREKEGKRPRLQKGLDRMQALTNGTGRYFFSRRCTEHSQRTSLNCTIMVTSSTPGHVGSASRPRPANR